MTGTSSIRGQIRVPNNFASSVVAAADIPIGDSSRLLKMFVVRIEKKKRNSPVTGSPSNSSQCESSSMEFLLLWLVIIQLQRGDFR